MKFNIKVYLDHLFTFPIVSLFVVIIILIHNIITDIIKPKYMQPFSKIKKIFKKLIGIVVIFLYIDAFLFVGTSLIHGIPLYFERNAQPQVLTGTVEKTKKILGHYYSGDESIYGSDHYAYWVTISGKKYYFMAKGNIRIGDNVEIVYLPKSKVVLEVKFIDS